MAKQELLDYILQSRNASYLDQAIRSALVDGGWQQADIDQAFYEYQNPSVGSQPSTHKAFVDVVTSGLEGASPDQLHDILSASSGAY